MSLTDNNTLRPVLFNEKHIASIRKLWTSGVKKDGKSHNYIDECNLEIIKHPFPVCLIRNVAPKNLLADALKVKALKFNYKSNDLYQFQQTKDLSNLNFVPIKMLHDFIAKDIRKWVETALVPTGLKEEISISFSKYSYSDRLLCHDDKCDDRHIAFVLYLTEQWDGSDGGNLELFETDSNGNPSNPVVSIPAEFNTLVLFEVTATSFHQVTEVLSKNKKRLSVNGWFHKENLPVWIEPPLSILSTSPPIETDSALEEFIFDKYLLLRNQIDIKNLFVSNSEIQLDEVFVPPILAEIEDELKSTEIAWTTLGPANYRNYEIAEEISLPPVLSQIVCLMQSDAWFLFLRKLTGLDLAPRANSDLSVWGKGKLPSCRVELQRWLPGSYTLVHDRDKEFHVSGLDVFIRFPAAEKFKDDDNPQPGHIVYIDKHSQDESCLLHLGYKKNSLGMVFRELETLRFTKYLDSSAKPFYQIQCLYIPWAPPDDEPDLKHVEDSDEEEEFEETYDEDPLTVFRDEDGGEEVVVGYESPDNSDVQINIKQEQNSDSEINIKQEQNSEGEEASSDEVSNSTKRKKTTNKSKKKLKKKD